MPVKFLAFLTPALALGFAGCAASHSEWVFAPDDGVPAVKVDDKKEAKGPKTIFEWAVGPKDDKDKDKSDKSSGDKGDKNAPDKDATDKNDNKKAKQSAGENDKGNEKEPPEEEEKLDPERPHYPDGSSLAGLGHVVLESGYTYQKGRTDGLGSNHSFPEALLRIGMFAEWFELRLGQNADSRQLFVNGVRENISGLEDFYLGVKLHLTEQKAFLPQSALVVAMTVPTGTSSLTNGQVMPTVHYNFTYDIIKDKVSMEGIVTAGRVLDLDGQFYSQMSAGLTGIYSITPKLDSYVEWFAFAPLGSRDPEVGPQHYADVGFLYWITKNFEIDVRAGSGLNQHAQGFFAGTGFAMRF
jgi:hypothetical protein